MPLKICEFFYIININNIYSDIIVVLNTFIPWIFIFDLIILNVRKFKGLCLLISGCVKQHRKFPFGNSPFRVQTLMRDIHRTMSTWGQYEKSIAAWIHSIKTERIHVPGYPPSIKQHHLPTLEASTHPTEKSCSSKNFTQFDSLPSELLRNIFMWHLGLVHRRKLKPVLVQLTQHNPIIRVSKSYKLKYSPFLYYMHYNVLQFVCTDRRLVPHNSDCDSECVRAHMIKHDPV